MLETIFIWHAREDFRLMGHVALPPSNFYNSHLLRSVYCVRVNIFDHFENLDLFISWFVVVVKFVGQMRLFLFSQNVLTNLRHTFTTHSRYFNMAACFALSKVRSLIVDILLVYFYFCD